jgi:N utilization substance protein B
MRRSDQRRDAVFAVYQRQVTGRPLEELLADAKPFTREIATGTDEHSESIDAEIAGLSRSWAIERIAPLELAIMRVALFELHHSPEVPAEVAIDEAVGFAQEFCGTDAPDFVNGILGAAARQAGAVGGAT